MSRVRRIVSGALRFENVGATLRNDYGPRAAIGHPFLYLYVRRRYWLLLRSLCFLMHILLFSITIEVIAS